METLALTINGNKITCPQGLSILEAADLYGIKIPRLCHHPDLKPFGACRMCLVEDEKTHRLLAACVTPAAAEMVIHTETPRVLKHRRNIVRLMIAEHPESCIVCNKGNRCRLRQAAADLGIGDVELYPMPNTKPYEEANPFMSRDLSKCILCGKCIRADHELVVTGAIDYNMRGFSSRPATLHKRGLEYSSCTFCGTCLSLCPTGALSPKNTRFAGSPEKEADAVCGFCGVGCRLTFGSIGNRVIETNPAHQPDSVNGATICVRGHFAHDYLNSPQRLISPLMKKQTEHGPELVPVGWDEALEAAVQRLKEIKETHGSESIGFMGSSKCTLEENYLFQKIARVCIGTNNVDNGGRLLGQHLRLQMDAASIDGYQPTRLSDLDKADVIMVLGADPDNSTPVVSYYLKRAAQKGIPLIVADPRRTDLVSFSRVWLPVKPGADALMLNAMAAHVLKKGIVDETRIRHISSDFALYRKKVTALEPDDWLPAAGLDKSQLHAAGDILAKKTIRFVIGNGILQQANSEPALQSAWNLALVCSAERCKFLLLSKENNALGALDMGTVPDLLPGRNALADEPCRRIWESAWNQPVPREKGLNMIEMMWAAERGDLKALYIMGENPLAALPEHDRVKTALARLECVVVQDILKTETATLADIVLAGAAPVEKRGAFTNLEGRIQSFDAVVQPPGKARSDWKILADIYARFNQPNGYDAIESIRSEIRRYVPMYTALGTQDEAWVDPRIRKECTGSKDTLDRFRFYPAASPKPKKPLKNYPSTAIVGTQRFQLGSGTRTRASERINAFEAAGRIEISLEDSEALRVEDGEEVTVTSAHGSVTRTCKIVSSLAPGFVFIPTGVDGNNAMNLFDLSGENGWKSCPVRLEKTE